MEKIIEKAVLIAVQTKDVSEEEDATLQEMSLMFAQGEFGKE